MLLFEVCAVIVSLAVVAIAVAALRAVARVEKAATQWSHLVEEIQQATVQVTDLARESREVVISIREAVVPIRRVAERFGAIGDQAAELSTSVLQEAGPAIRTAVALARGMRSSTGWLLELLSERFLTGRAATHGRSENE